MDQDCQEWRRSVDDRLTDLTVKVAVLTRDLRWFGVAILLLLTAQIGAELSR